MITLRSDMTVELVDAMGSDQRICQAARVSTLGIASLETGEAAGLINFLMKNRHGSPFEHGAMTFLIEAPIMVWREFMRHRIGFSYNETSGRYKELEPVFYVPDNGRQLVQVGKPGEYKMQSGSAVQLEFVQMVSRTAYETAWGAYQAMLKAGIAKEIAREVLPVATYSAAYVSCNPRSLMHFLSLRTKSRDAMFPSFPQREIEMVAEGMEALFVERWPLTWEAFCSNGRVAP